MHQRVVRRHLRASVQDTAEEFDRLRATLSVFRGTEAFKHLARMEEALEILSRMGSSQIPVGEPTGVEYGNDADDTDTPVSQDGRYDQGVRQLGPSQYNKPEVNYDFLR